MVSIHSIIEDEDVTHISFNLSKEEISTLIFAGISETTYDHTLIIPYPENEKDALFNLYDLQEASMDNNLSKESGYLYLQVGLQTAIIAGINTMNSQVGEDIDCMEEACGTTQDHPVHTDQD